MVTPERLVSLQRSWCDLASQFQQTPSAAYAIFDRLVESYSESHRHYHTLEHIAEMLRIVPRLARELPDRRILTLAVWFHDVVYDPRKQDNEAHSAVVAKDWLEPWALEERQRFELEQLILATRHHEFADLPNIPGISELLDADLAILGAAEDRYQRYAKAIRQEYDWVSDLDYRQGRIGVLENFLKREKIYRTAMLAELGEEAARRNLQTEIETLRAG